MKINISLAIILRLVFLPLLLAVTACAQDISGEEKAALRKEVLGLEPGARIDYENIEHLVFLHKYPTEKDKALSAASVALAKESMADGKRLFDRVQYEEAIEAYPTPQIVLAFGNGFLRIAQHYLNKSSPDLSSPLGDHDVQWQFKGAAFYYDLALRFSQRIDEPFDARQHRAIEAAIQCIETSLIDPKYNVDHPCEVVE